MSYIAAGTVSQHVLDADRKIALGKPFVDAITWWNFSENVHFFPHSGLLDKHNSPKESYSRLKKLIHRIQRHELNASRGM